jgi:hypothetical protein
MALDPPRRLPVSTEHMAGKLQDEFVRVLDNARFHRTERSRVAAVQFECQQMYFEVNRRREAVCKLPLHVADVVAAQCEDASLFAQRCAGLVLTVP